MCEASENILLIDGNLSEGTTTNEADESKIKYLVFYIIMREKNWEKFVNTN